MSILNTVRAAANAVSKAAKTVKQNNPSSGSGGNSGSGSKFTYNPDTGQGSIAHGSWSSASGQIKDGYGNVIGTAKTTQEYDDFMRNRMGTGGGGGGSSRYNVQVDPINIERYRTENATIQDIMNKYGFDYSREYAARQAEAEAQAKRDAGAAANRAVDTNVRDAVSATDHDYFQQYQQSLNNQAATGLNAGLAADQQARLAMSQQAALGGMYRDANAERMNIQDALGRVELERLAREDSLHNERLQQGFQNAMTYTDSQRQTNNALLQAALAQRGQDIDLGQFNANLNENARQFDGTMGFQRDQFDWQKILDEAGLTGQYNGQSTVAEQQRNFSNALAEGQLTGNYMNNDARQGLMDYLNLKQQTEQNWASMTPQQREAARLQGDAMRNQLALMGINPALLDTNLNSSRLQEQIQRGNQGAQTIDSQRLQQEQQQFAEMMGWNREQFNNLSAEARAQLEWQREQYSTLSASEKEQFAIARAQLEEQIRQFDNEDAWRRYTYDNMSLEQRKQFNENVRRFNEEMAWEMEKYEISMDYNYDSLRAQSGIRDANNQYSSRNFLE